MSQLTEAHHIPPMMEGVFVREAQDGRPHLLGGYCAACDRRYFPRPSYCRTCLEPVEETDLGTDGFLHAFTVVRIRPPLGFPQPYAVGYVDLAVGGLRVFCLVDPDRIGELKIGIPVELRVASFGDDGAGEPRLRPYFTPATTGVAL